MRAAGGLLFSVAIAFGLALGCGSGAGGDPFGTGGSHNVGGEGGAAGARDEDAGPPPTGEACVDDGECDDGIDCTLDACDPKLLRCRHEPNDAACDDGIYCDGIEKCSLTLGCQRGPVVGCSDDYSCTIDACIERTQKCSHELRDADGDGDPPVSCTGTDCNDLDPLVSGNASERCGNGVDDDCDGEVDEDDCVLPLHDRCGDALEIDASGSYSVSTFGAAKDYGISCEAKSGDAAFRDVVLAVTVPDDGPRDVDIVALLPRDGPRVHPGDLVLAASDQCGKASGETGCVAGLVTSTFDGIARLVLRNLASGAHAVYVAAAREAEVELHVDFREPEPAPTNETCGTSALLKPGVPVDVLLAGVTTDLDSACGEGAGELVYHFDLTEKSDVHLQAVALDDYGSPIVSLRDAGCVSFADELTCRRSPQAMLFARALAAGSYTVALGGTAPAALELVLRLAPPSAAPATEGCSDPPPLEPGVTEQVSLDDATDAVQIGALVGAPDATYRLDLDERSDVMLLESGSDGDRGGVLLAEAACASTADVDASASSNQWPVRAVAHGVGPGSLRAVVETAAGNPTTLTALTRPAVNSVFVQGADECADAYEIPVTGGRFEGNTDNEYAQYNASCDYGGQGPGGGPEQMLKLTLKQPRRVVLDTTGSSFQTILVVRHADTCPGEEVEGDCAVTYTSSDADAPTYALVDTVLDAGSYFVQIDGYNGDKGRWVLEAFTSEVSAEVTP